MMTANRKYELVKINSIVFNGKTLYRIKALRDFNGIKTGDLGGYIESEDNLSHEGDCWVYNEAKVLDNARVLDDVKVICKAVMREHSMAIDNAIIADHSQLFGHSLVCNYGLVQDFSILLDNSIVCNEACAKGNAILAGRTILQKHYDVNNGFYRDVVFINYEGDTIKR